MHATVSTVLSVRIAHIVKTLEVANRAKTLFQQLTHATVTIADFVINVMIVPTVISV